MTCYLHVSFACVVVGPTTLQCTCQEWKPVAQCRPGDNTTLPVFFTAQIQSAILLPDILHRLYLCTEQIPIILNLNRCSWLFRLYILCFIYLMFEINVDVCCLQNIYVYICTQETLTDKSFMTFLSLSGTMIILYAPMSCSELYLQILTYASMFKHKAVAGLCTLGANPLLP